VMLTVSWINLINKKLKRRSQKRERLTT
jgi:hypothetical protein